MNYPNGIGRITLFDANDLNPSETTNDWCYSWAHILAMLIGPGDPAFKPNYVYFEYQNVANPGNSVTIPTIDRSEGASYYLGLSSSPTSDYLRVPVITATPARDAQYSGTQNLPAGQFNQVIFEALTTGTSGVHGKPFSNAANSKIYGIAIAAAPVPGDHTQDVVWGRGYYATQDQKVAPAVGSLRMTYAITGK